MDLFNESFNDSFPLSCRRAVLTLLPKKGDLQEIKNWRRLSAGHRLQAAVQGPVLQAEEGDGPGGRPDPDLLCARQVNC